MLRLFSEGLDFDPLLKFGFTRKFYHGPFSVRDFATCFSFLLTFTLNIIAHSFRLLITQPGFANLYPVIQSLNGFVIYDTSVLVFAGFGVLRSPLNCLSASSQQNISAPTM